MTDAIKVGIYLRVSSKYGRQDEANQEPDCVRLCESRKWQYEFFRERESAVKHRPEWQRLLEDARLGKLRGVVFWSIHRIGRKRIEIAADIAELMRWGQAVVSVKQSFLDVDTSPEMGKIRTLLIQWFGWFAEAERDDLIDKTNLALRRVKENLARNGTHVSKKGNTITRLGRMPKYNDETRERIKSTIAALPSYTAGQISKALAAEGIACPRQTVREFMPRKGAA